MQTDPDPPSIPTELLEAGGWTLTDEFVETVYEISALRVRGATREYEDRRLRTTLRDASDGRLDHRLRFVAVTRLGFQPSLPFGVTPTLVLPTIRSEAEDEFKTRLRNHGLTDVEREESQRVRVAGRRRARLTKFSATDPFEGSEKTVSLECWVTAWTHAGNTTIVTGGYPAVTLSSHLELEDSGECLSRSGQEYREEFIELLQSVE